MRALILTCNTGGGHNSTARSIQQLFQQNGIFCQSVDSIRFISEKLSKFMSWGHTTMYRHVPGLFRVGYDFIEKHPALLDEDAAVYKLLTDGTDELYRYVTDGNYDTLICTHVFSGLLTSRMLYLHPMPIRTAFVATDYTCSPGAANSQLDFYFIPAPSLADEFASLGVDRDRIIPSGIPVLQEFYSQTDPRAAKARLGIDPDHPHLLMMCGSMGCGPIEKLTELIAGQMDERTELTVVCGTNQRLCAHLTQEFSGKENVHILGFSDNISLLMDSADLYLTKPGGLSSTEAAVKGLPMVLVDAVAGCEAYNLRFFTGLGGAVTAETPEELARLCAQLLDDPCKRQQMSRKLRSFTRNSAQVILDALTQASCTSADI